jgi:hypothetical protein
VVVDKIATFLIMYALTAAPAQGLPQKRNPNDLMANSAISSKLMLGNTLEEQVRANYAAQVVESDTSKNILENAYQALGEPDNKYVELGPGERLTLKMAKPFTIMNLGDIAGRVACMGGEYSLAVPVRIADTDERYKCLDAEIAVEGQKAWMMCIPSAEGGFRLPIAPQAPIDEIMITNIGKEKLKIDAVIGYGR